MGDDDQRRRPLADVDEKDARLRASLGVRTLREQKKNQGGKRRQFFRHVLSGVPSQWIVTNRRDGTLTVIERLCGERLNVRGCGARRSTQLRVNGARVRQCPALAGP